MKKQHTEQAQMIRVYTDGMCEPNPGNGGWGFIILSSLEIKMHGGKLDTTNNRMELMAVIKALEYFDSSENVLIFSDSMYVVDGFNSWMHKWKERGKSMKNMDLWNRLLDLKKFHKKVEAEWVKGHSGNKYNDIADELSVIGMEETVEIAIDSKLEKEGNTWRV